MGTTNVAKLCDFGLSSLLSDLSTFAQSSSKFGTQRFTSPELWDYMVETKRNEGSDVWAFGCTSGEAKFFVLDNCIATNPPQDFVETTPLFLGYE